MSPHPYINRRGRIGYAVPYNDGRNLRAEGVIVHVGTDTEAVYSDDRGMIPMPFSSVVIRVESGEHVTGRLAELTLLDEDPMNKRGGTR